MFEWPQSWVSVPIAPKELVPVIMACAVWGRAWRGKSVRVNCDNQAVVAVLNSGYSKDDRSWFGRFSFSWPSAIYGYMHTIS